jgi:hypothetical protein
MALLPVSLFVSACLALLAVAMSDDDRFGWHRRQSMHLRTPSYVIERESNVVRVDFGREPDPPAPKFPGAGALHGPPSGESGEPVLTRWAA